MAYSCPIVGTTDYSSISASTVISAMTLVDDGGQSTEKDEHQGETMQVYSRATAVAGMDCIRGMAVMGCTIPAELCCNLMDSTSYASVSSASTASMDPTLTCSFSTFSSCRASDSAYSTMERPI